ncbi:MAG TPA: methylmalonyl-CoA mutase [Bacteroides sp.]|nr:methylmalonyl-CoA mutase [Bacteroides sp.]
MNTKKKYSPKNHIRIVTATSLFDGHDAAINIMRRILQSTGVEVIHLGHNRSVQEIVDCAIQEDVQGIAVTSYQGGHMEFYTFIRQLLDEKGASNTKIFGGGGGVILPDEIKQLANSGAARIFSPDDGRKLGLQGMINEVVKACDFPIKGWDKVNADLVRKRDSWSIARLITGAENNPSAVSKLLNSLGLECSSKTLPVIGITGTGGSGKSSLIDEIIRRYLSDYPKHNVGIVSIDPTKKKTGGALLGDRIRMNAIRDKRVYMRSMATRRENLAISEYVQGALCVLKSAGFNLIILETSGIGQASTEVVDYSDFSMYVMTPEYGAATQLEKIDMLDFADLVVVNKSDRPGAEDALRDVRKQYQRNHVRFESDLAEMPVFGTVASDFNDPGVEKLYTSLLGLLSKKAGKSIKIADSRRKKYFHRTDIIPGKRIRYLSEISESINSIGNWIKEQVETADLMYGLSMSIHALQEGEIENSTAASELKNLYRNHEKKLDRENLDILKGWEAKKTRYNKKKYNYEIRGKNLSIDTHSETMSHLSIPKVILPPYKGWGDILRWILKENVPGEFPYTAGVFPFKREEEDPTRMFAGEGGAERTNQRFHYLCRDMPARRLSTAFDSVTLYGSDPDKRPDIYGKLGNSGVSIACLDDAKKLYSGFNLLDPNTSVSMTINGPAPILVGYFLNAAIDQQCEIYIRQNSLMGKLDKKLKTLYDDNGFPRPCYEGKLPQGNDGLGLLLLGITGDKILPPEIYQKIKAETISAVRGTVQADILKEDQAQNTCIFSTNFSLKMMGDVQQYFIDNLVSNFYSVSISGYHIAEAGANPISQLAFTLANGFTYVEYYLSRGMDIDEFAPSLSFFFSNGLDPEYTVIGRVARRIWSRAMKYKYGANQRSQKLKYHIQTSGRSLHAQEIEFNDIRTTLQALHAVYDNCNSLHTNAYDEAITTPTEESVRRALAIQLIINQEFGLTKNQNPFQGSFIIEELTDLVEEAVLAEFDRLTERGGVLGAMETMYQRSRIQEESMYYESLKNTGELPLVGVNTFLSQEGSPTMIPGEVIRSTNKERADQLRVLKRLNHVYGEASARQIMKLKEAAIGNRNVFEELMEVSKVCSIGQITQALFEVGGEYRRNM